MTSYLLDRFIYVEVQGTSGKPILMPNKSVVQGSKMPGMFFCLHMMDITSISRMMKNSAIFKLLMGENINHNAGITHKITCYRRSLLNLK